MKSGLNGLESKGLVGKKQTFTSSHKMLWLHLTSYLFWRYCESQLIQGISAAVKMFSKRNIDITLHLYWFFSSCGKTKLLSILHRTKIDMVLMSGWCCFYILIFCPRNSVNSPLFFSRPLTYTQCLILFTLSHTHRLCRIRICKVLHNTKILGSNQNFHEV